MKAAVIFLDVDGVLNCLHSWKRRSPRFGHVDPTCLRSLQEIIDATGAEIVVSSCWRRARLSGNIRLLRRFGLQCKVIGQTSWDFRPRMDGQISRCRGDEIASWLRKHGWRKFIIIDDDRDMRHFHSRLVHTRFVRGLRSPDVVTAITMLTENQ